MVVASDEIKANILVVDDDTVTGNLIRRVLEQQFQATAVKSGMAALEYFKDYRVDLVVLDYLMPEMDGFETMEALRKLPAGGTVPVIMLTGKDLGDVEFRALKMGVSDFISKPVVPEVLIQRVSHMVQLARLQGQLETEVDRKTKELVLINQKVEKLSMQIVRTLSGTIDAKDKYTNGHSRRVAEYSMEIARRYGYSPERQQDVYIAGLLHDIGKIGIRDTIINKTGVLTDEEFAMIKQHPTIGAEILKNITELPDVATGAHWHHEKYDGSGYPDHLKGEEIPEIARIIGVADAYAAMTSNRSYRGSLNQAKVRGEIARGRGTQFSPEFADIMLQMIDEDTEFRMQEIGHEK